MRKLWLVAVTTYLRQFRSGSFLLVTFGLPLLIVAAGAIPLLRGRGGDLPRVGYVDATGQLAAVTEVPVGEETLSAVPLADLAAARGALDRGEIGGYLVIPAGYFTGEGVAYYGAEAPGPRLAAALRALLRRALLPDQPAWAIERLADPAELTFVALQDGVELSSEPAVMVHMLLPAVLALFFALAVFTTAGQLGSAMVREQEQRALEIVVTSLAPRELVAGRIGGMALLGLTQLALWIAAALVALAVGLSDGPGIGSLVIPWRACLWAALLGVPGYFLYAVLAAGLGIIAGDSQQAQQLAGVLGLVSVAPFWLMSVVIEAPTGALAVALTLFPLTGTMFGLLRMAVSEVPVWQLVASLALMLAALGGSVWCVARVFRAAMLLCGQRVRPQHIWRALRDAR
ncbi:MAG: ABC transporter permease [Anaerolineae bacterium]|nr:ABC transporter permease [Anaerolineae bacterium]